MWCDRVSTPANPVEQKLAALSDRCAAVKQQLSSTQAELAAMRQERDELEAQILFNNEGTSVGAAAETDHRGSTALAGNPSTQQPGPKQPMCRSGFFSSLPQ